MKKVWILVLAFVLAAVSLSACAKKEDGVMSYAEFEAAALQTSVTVDTYVQAKQGWWENEGVGVASFYTQNEDGAYFLYNMPCSREDYDKLVPGTKIRVTGIKAMWPEVNGEVEITEATYKIDTSKTWIASAKDVTSLLGTDDLVKEMNKFVAFKGMTVEKYNDDGAAFNYKWDGSGKQGDDLYFKVSVGCKTYTFTVESYLCGKDTDVYKAVEALQVGDKIDMEGFLYWYEGANPHITSVTAAK